MLAQNFMTAKDLQISEATRDALIKTLALMDSGGLVHKNIDRLGIGTRRDLSFDGLFNMGVWGVKYPTCGTVCCIRGTAQLISGQEIGEDEWTYEMSDLFLAIETDALESITVEQAAMALRSYLTTGKPNWPEAMKA